jgi:hypothetical protein
VVKDSHHGDTENKELQGQPARQLHEKNIMRRPIGYRTYIAPQPKIADRLARFSFHVADAFRFEERSNTFGERRFGGGGGRVDGEAARVFSAEHLAAIALQTARAKDKARLLQFLEAGVLDVARFQEIVHRHGLVDAWMKFERQFLADTP